MTSASQPDSVPGSSEGCAVVTGASSGIGAATAVAFASAGIPVVAAARHPERLTGHPRYRELEAWLHLAPADLTVPEEIDRVLAEARAAQGPIRHVIHSVGVEYPVGWFRDATPETFRRVIAALIDSPVLVVRQALEVMAADGGTVGVISSGAAYRPTPGRALYSASKIALNRLIESLGLECAAATPQIGVFGVLPGRVDTPAQRRLMALAGEADPAFQLGRFRSSEGVIPADEIGPAVAALAMRPAADVNGGIFRYDGGEWRRRQAVD